MAEYQFIYSTKQPIKCNACGITQKSMQVISGDMIDTTVSPRAWFAYCRKCMRKITSVQTIKPIKIKIKGVQNQDDEKKTDKPDSRELGVHRQGSKKGQNKTSSNA